MTHTVSGAKEPSGKVCEIAGAPLGFKSFMWMHFCFSCVKKLENEKRQQTDKKRIISQ